MPHEKLLMAFSQAFLTMVSDLHFKILDTANRELSRRFEKPAKCAPVATHPASNKPRWSIITHSSTFTPRGKMLSQRGIYNFLQLVASAPSVICHILLTSQTYSVILFLSSWTGFLPRCTLCVASCPHP